MTDRQTTSDRQTDRQTDDRQRENSNPSVPYDAFACFAGLTKISILGGHCFGSVGGRGIGLRSISNLD